MISRFTRQGVLWVNPTGNNGNTRLANGQDSYTHYYSPQSLNGHPLATNAKLLIVGGVNPDGTLWTETEPHLPGTPGAIDVYAQAAGVTMAIDKNDRPENSDQMYFKAQCRTSGASGQVAGLVAYFLGLPEFQASIAHLVPPQNGLGDYTLYTEGIKQYVIRASWSRVPWGGVLSANVIRDSLNYKDSIPNLLPVAYNYAWTA